MRATRWGWPVVAALVLSTSGCAVTPPFTRSDFSDQAATTLDSAISETATTTMVLDAYTDGHATKAYANVVVTGTEGAIGGLSSTFGSVDPPSVAQDRLRDDVLTLLGDAEDGIAHARIALRRNDPQALGRARKEIDDVSGRLDAARVRLP